MKEIKIGGIIMFIGFVFFVVQNEYFGWNTEPMSDLEAKADKLNNLIITVGFIVYLSPLRKLYENAIEKNEKNKK